MWLGEQITERGIGNGMSLLIFAGIVVGLPRGIIDLSDKARNFTWGPLTPVWMILLVTVMVAVVAFIVFVERSERRIPVQYAKRIVGRKMMGGQSTHLPLRVNSGGVMPVIFASSIVTIPQTLLFGLRDNPHFGPVLRALYWGEPLYTVLYAAASFSLPTSTFPSSSTPTRLPTTCGSMADLFLEFAPVNVPQTTSMRF